MNNTTKPMSGSPVVNSNTHHDAKITGITIEYEACSKTASIQDSSFGVTISIEDKEAIIMVLNELVRSYEQRDTELAANPRQ